jgi:group I intron endonuclease
MEKFTKNGGIYCFENILDGKKYIGQSKNIRVRINQHKRQLNLGIDQCIVLQRSWSKYGEENFIIYVVEECDKNILTERELFWVDKFGSMDNKNGYNIAPIGEPPMSGRKHTEETKQKMSESAKAQPPRSEEYRKHLSEGHMGYIPTEETRKKQSDAGKLRKNSEETRLKISLSNMGHEVSDESKKKMSEAKMGNPSPMKGKKHTPESLKKMSDIKKGKRASEETKKKMSDSRKGIIYSEDRNKKISDSWTKERKEKWSAIMKERPLTDEYRKNLSDSGRGTKKIKLNPSSNFIGVNFHKASKKFQARIMSDDGRLYLGLFDNEILAAIAYNEAAIYLYGYKAKLNIITEEEYNSVMINS